MDDRTETANTSPGATSKRRLFRRSRVRDLVLLLALATAFDWNLPMAIAGTVLVVLGLALQTWSKAVLRRDSELGTNGPYAICQHPFYLGNFIYDIGLCTLSGTWWLVLAYPVVFWIAYRYTFRYEEALLRKLFGQAHVDFCKKTPRLFPSFLGLARRWRAACSFRVLLRERQVSRAVRLLALPLWIVVAARAWHSLASLDSALSLGLIADSLALVICAYLVTRFLEKPVVAALAKQPVTGTMSSF